MRIPAYGRQDVDRMMRELNAAQDWFRDLEDDNDLTRPNTLCPVAGGFIRRWHANAARWRDRKTFRGDYRFQSEINSVMDRAFWSYDATKIVERRDDVIEFLFDSAAKWLSLATGGERAAALIRSFPRWSQRGDDEHRERYQAARAEWDQLIDDALVGAEVVYGAAGVRAIQDDWVCSCETSGYMAACTLCAIDLGEAFVRRLKFCCLLAHLGRKMRAVNPTVKSVRDACLAMLQRMLPKECEDY